MCVLCKVTQSCLALCNPWTVACQAPLSMGILQGRILEWDAMPSSRVLYACAARPALQRHPPASAQPHSWCPDPAVSCLCPWGWVRGRELLQEDWAGAPSSWGPYGIPDLCKTWVHQTPSRLGTGSRQDAAIGQDLELGIGSRKLPSPQHFSETPWSGGANVAHNCVSREGKQEEDLETGKCGAWG